MTTRRNVLFGFSALALGGGHAGVKVARAGTAFGTIVRLNVTAGDEATAIAAIDAGFAEMRAVHRAASLFEEASEVSQLNRHGRLDRPSEILTEIIAHSDRLHRLTRGAFDPSVQPLWALWAQGAPRDGAVELALSNVGWAKLGVAAERLSLSAGGALSFNGIAQGYAADRVMSAMQTLGVTSVTVDSGEIGRWNAGGALRIQHPRHDTAIGTLTLASGFAAVSGDYASTFTPDFLHHHIFDPALGFSPRELSSVVVVAPSGAMADGLATAFMVMGTAKTFDCLAMLPGHAALCVDKVGNVEVSSGMNKLFQKT
jgi:thiamine biosynthesis lipoprotein